MWPFVDLSTQSFVLRSLSQFSFNFSQVHVQTVYNVEKSIIGHRISQKLLTYLLSLILKMKREITFQAGCLYLEVLFSQKRWFRQKQ